MSRPPGGAPTDKKAEKEYRIKDFYPILRTCPVRGALPLPITCPGKGKPFITFSKQNSDRIVCPVFVKAAYITI